MKDMGQSASRDALAPQINEPHQPAVSNSEQGGFTPGPWRVEQDTTLIWGNCDPEDRSTYGMGYPVAEAKIMLGHGSPFCRSARHDEAEANARLIAAAPDLLAAAKFALTVIGGNAARDELAAAIRRAEGQS